MKTTSQKIAVVTDSSASIPAEFARRYGIQIVPVTVKMGTKTWQEGTELEASALYQMMQTSSDLPSSEPPDTSVFQHVFIELSRDQGIDGIVAILPPNELSHGMCDAARAAAESGWTIPIEILDSRGLSMMTGFPAIAAAKAVLAGGDVQTVKQTAQSLIGKIHLYVIVDSFEHLHRHGKIGRAAKWIGGFLKLKPMFHIANAETITLGAVPRNTVQDKLFTELDQYLGNKEKVHVAVFHVNNAEIADKYTKAIELRYQPLDIIEVECCASIGISTGPGTVGFVCYAE